MQEASASVVEYVFAMVGSVYHCGWYFEAFEQVDNRVEHEVGISYGIVVGVEQLRTVCRACLCVVCRGEMYHVLRIPFSVIEV